MLALMILALLLLIGVAVQSLLAPVSASPQLAESASAAAPTATGAPTEAATSTPTGTTGLPLGDGSSQGAQPAPSAARLSVVCYPVGAEVSVDGLEQGAAPVSLDEVAAGEHEVRVSLIGWREWEEEVALEPGETKLLEVHLEELPEPTPSPPVPTVVVAAAEAAPTSAPAPVAEEVAPIAAEPDEQLSTDGTEPIYPVAVMVENYVDARPQSGLARADIVYEALVEGGISRFMAIYVHGRSDAIGPVRSARHYFVYLAAEYNASLIHIGASPQGYAALSATKIVRLDETYGDPGFWRSQARYAPHNAYTSTDLIRTSLDRYRKVTPGGLAGFKFQADTPPAEGPEAQTIDLVYPGGYSYSVKYVYSPEENVYRRYMDGLAHKDANSGEQVAPRNVVVQLVNSWVIDQVGRLDMDQVGSGKALYFRDGVVTEGYWHKASYGDVTEWYDADWNPVVFNPGKTWIQIIPPTAKLSY